MSNSITPSKFDFHGHTVRIVMRDGEPWFVASDICKALEYSNPSKAVADHLDTDERYNQPLERGGSLLVINESGLYALVLRSRKPEARKFAKWVTNEVLPSIRKTGAYQAGQQQEIDIEPHREPAFDILNAEAMRHAKETARQYFNDFRAGRQAGLDIPHEVLAGIVTEALQRNRMVVSFSHEGRLNASVIAHDKWIFSTAEFIKGIENGDVSMTSEQYARTASACTTKLSGRVEHLEARLTKPKIESGLRQRSSELVAAHPV